MRALKTSASLCALLSRSRSDLTHSTTPLSAMQISKAVAEFRKQLDIVKEHFETKEQGSKAWDCKGEDGIDCFTRGAWRKATSHRYSCARFFKAFANVFDEVSSRCEEAAYSIRGARAQLSLFWGCLRTALTLPGYTTCCFTDCLSEPHNGSDPTNIGRSTVPSRRLIDAERSRRAKRQACVEHIWARTRQRTCQDV